MQEFMDYQKNRGLDKKPFVALNESANIIEEVLEMNGFNIPKENRESLKQEIEIFMSKMFSVGISERDEKFDSVYSPLDALSDIKNFCDGGQMKIGYDPNKCDIECAKEVHSRVGSIINGKFEKDLSPLAVDMWYKADYSLCKLPKEDIKTEIHDGGYNTNKTSVMLNNVVHEDGFICKEIK